MSKPTFKEGVSGLYFVRNPQTGQIERHEGADAARLMDVNDWLPVTPDEAASFIQQQAVERNATTVQGLALGVERGLTGGLPELLLDPDSLEAQGLRNIEQGAGGAALAGEIAGTVAPFLPVGKAVRLGTAPGLLDAAGDAATRALRGAKPGAARTILSRVAGVGLEGAGQVTLGEVRRAHLHDDPLTAGRLMDAYALGALVPALVVGAPLGAAERALNTLSRRALARGGVVKQNAWKPGVSEKDVRDIAMRDHGVAAPGLLNEFHAANAKSPLLDDPAIHAILNDSGLAGEQLRREVFQEGAQLRDAAERELAERLNEGLEVDRFASTNWSGRLKEERVRQWINDNEAAPADVYAYLQSVRQSGRIDDLAAQAAQAVRRKTEAGQALATELGVDARTASEVVALGLASGDEAVIRAMARVVDPATVSASSNAWREQALRAIDEYGEIFATMKERGRGHIGDQPGKVDRALELLSQVRRDIETAPRSKGFTELDWLKKRLADYAKPDQYLGAGDDVARNARNAHESFRQMLEDATLWGDRAAIAQRDMNALFHKRMARKDSFYDHWFEDAGVPDPTNPWANLKQATPERVRSAIGDVMDVNHERVKMYQEHIRETKDLIAAMRKHYELTPEEVARMAAHEASVDAAQDALARAVYFNLRTNQGKALLQSGGLGSGIGARVAAGYVVGGLPGALIGMYVMNKLNPGASLYARSVMERLARQSEGRMIQGITKLLTGKLPKIPSIGVAQTLSRLSRIADSSDGIKQEEYQQSVKELLATAQDPQKIELSLRNELGDIPEMMPNLIPNAVARVQKGLAVALAAAPAKPVQTLLGEETSPVGDIELDVWERVTEAALDPSSILDMAADGELIPEAVDAAEAVDPELVRQIRLEVANQIDAMGDSMSYDRQLQVAILFKMPVDQTTTSEYINAQQLMFAAGEQKPTTDPRSFGETGVHKTEDMSEADRLTSGIPPQ